MRHRLRMEAYFVKSELREQRRRCRKNEERGKNPFQVIQGKQGRATCLAYTPKLPELQTLVA